MTDVTTLNNRFGIQDHLSFTTDANGMVYAQIKNRLAEAHIAVQGAHLLTWAPTGQVPVIWLSEAAKFAPGKSVRGGVPICWPWFGPHPSQTSFPAHGYARTVPWEVIASAATKEGATRISLRLIVSEATRAQWPHATPVELHLTIGNALECELITRNQGQTAVTVGDALHTYFAISDIRNVEVLGLDGLEYLDKVGPSTLRKQQGAVRFASETDRIYLESVDDCIIADPGLKRRIRIQKRGSRSSVVWNPWIEKANKMGDLGDAGYLKMVCVESTNAAADVVNIAPGGEHRLWVRYSVEQ
ncbi:MAG: D-hexose-6-phosphate mutarotase [Pseudomonadota bacterium]